jgi:hypothetical protein
VALHPARHQESKETIAESWRTGTVKEPERLERRRQALVQLLGRPLVERQGTDRGRRRPVATSQAIRATSVVVLPEPAGAMHSTGPGGAVAAAR